MGEDRVILRRILGKVYRCLFYILNRPFYGALGKNSIIQSPLLIFGKKRIFIGDRVRIMPMARIEAICTWKSAGETMNFESRILIDDGVDIGQGFHLTVAELVHIHKDVLIAPYVYITDVMHDYDDVGVPVQLQGINFRPTEIGEGSHIGIGAKIMEGVKIGRHCVIGANSVVTHDVPDYCVVAGSPAHIIKRYNNETKLWEKIQMEQTKK